MPLELVDAPPIAEWDPPDRGDDGDSTESDREPAEERTEEDGGESAPEGSDEPGQWPEEGESG